MQNLGTVPGNLNISTSAITNNENTRSAIESAAGDTTGGAAEGELGGIAYGGILDGHYK